MDVLLRSNDLNSVSVNDKTMIIYPDSPQKAKEYGVDKIPAIVILRSEGDVDRDYGIRFFGILGLLIGPLALSYFFLLIQMYREEYIDEEDKVMVDGLVGALEVRSPSGTWPTFPHTGG